VPAFKCHPSGPTADATNDPQDVPAPAPLAPSPELVNCGPGFFDSTTATAVARRFGTIDCFRFDGRRKWIVVSDGMETDGDGGAPGGSIVAVEACNGVDATSCLDPETEHSFSDFTVAYDPDPRAWPAHFQTSFNGQLLSISDGPCGLFTLNVDSLKWHGGHQSDLDAQLHGGGGPQVPAPRPVDGGTALTTSAPASVGACS
jgi:hypothetical protein